MEFVGDRTGRMRHIRICGFLRRLDARFDDFYPRHLFVIIADANKILDRNLRTE